MSIFKDNLTSEDFIVKLLFAKSKFFNVNTSEISAKSKIEIILSSGSGICPPSTDKYNLLKTQFPYL